MVGLIDRFEGRWWFLSNFHPCQIEHQGIKYPSVEHFYVASKSDSEQLINGIRYTKADFREMVSMLKSAAIAKTIGAKIKVRKGWDEKKLELMNWAVREKFKDEGLAQMLVETGDAEIVERNDWHDNFWGQCRCTKCSGRGKNHLGKILMKVRDELRGTQKKGLDAILGV